MKGPAFRRAFASPPALTRGLRPRARLRREGFAFAQSAGFNGAGVLGAALVGFGKAIHVSAFSMESTGADGPRSYN